MTHRDENIWALIPVKRFDQAKMRLAGALESQERAALAKTMLGDVLRAVKNVSQLAGIAVITNDETAAALAQIVGAHVLDDPNESGTNAAVENGILRLRANGTSAVLVVPSDIPRVRADDIRAVLRAGRHSPLVLAPASHDQGTNMLLQDCSVSFTPRFGCNSFLHHLDTAAASGLTPRIVLRDAIGLDIDEPADLALLLADAGQCATRKLLRQFTERRMVSAAAFPQLSSFSSACDGRRIR